MPDFCLNDQLERFGDWCLPDRPERLISGKLTYSELRTELELSEALTAVAGDFSAVDEHPIYPVIHGTSTKSELISVLNASRTGLNINFGLAGLRNSEKVISSFLIIGAHVAPNQHYQQMRFIIPGLTAWLGVTPVLYQNACDAPTGGLIETCTNQLIAPEIIELQSIDAQIEFGSGWSSKINPYRSISFEVHGWLCIKPKQPKPIEWFFNQHSKLNSLLAFIAGTPMPPTMVSANIENSSRPLSILFTMRAAAHCKLAQPADFFLPRRATAISLEQIVRNWFAGIESVLVPSQLALGTISSKDLWPHVRFASLVQALEGFHRGSYPGTYMLAEDYEKIRAAISSGIPPTLSSDHKDALRSRIKYGNQISLSKRLSELASRLGPDLAKLILGCDGKVPRSWVDTRNYHSHWDEELLHNTLSGQDMYNANVRMEHFLRSLFLLLAGVKPDEIVRAMSGISSTAQQLIQINIIDRHSADPSQPKGIYFSVYPKNMELSEPSRTDDAQLNPE
jgi:hypothetical protein